MSSPSGGGRRASGAGEEEPAAPSHRAQASAAAGIMGGVVGRGGGRGVGVRTWRAGSVGVDLSHRCWKGQVGQATATAHTHTHTHTHKEGEGVVLARTTTRPVRSYPRCCVTFTHVHAHTMPRPTPALRRSGGASTPVPAGRSPHRRAAAPKPLVVYAAAGQVGNEGPIAITGVSVAVYDAGWLCGAAWASARRRDKRGICNLRPCGAPSSRGSGKVPALGRAAKEARPLPALCTYGTGQPGPGACLSRKKWRTHAQRGRPLLKAEKKNAARFRSTLQLSRPLPSFLTHPTPPLPPPHNTTPSPPQKKHRRDRPGRLPPRRPLGRNGHARARHLAGPRTRAHPPASAPPTGE